VIGDIIVGVDIGSSKVTTVIAKSRKQYQMEVLGCGSAPTTGIKKGLIVDIESVAEAVKKSINMAERTANVRVAEVYLGITGLHVLTVSSHGAIQLGNTQKEITNEDVKKVLQDCKAFDIPLDKQVVDIIPHQYIVDGYDEIVDPIGMRGTILEVDADVVLGSTIAVNSMIKCVEKAGYEVGGMILETLATSNVVLTDEEKELGVILIDVGAGKTDISYYKGKRLQYYDSISVGSEHITNDIVIVLKVSYNEADKLKKQFSFAEKSLITHDQNVSIYSLSENKQVEVRVSEVVEIIEARVSEIFKMVAEKIKALELKENVSAGVVISGLGIYNVVGADKVASKTLDLPVRLFNPNLPGKLGFEYVTALGIVKYIGNMKAGKNDMEILNMINIGSEEPPKITGKGLLEKFIQFLKQ